MSVSISWSLIRGLHDREYTVPLYGLADYKARIDVSGIMLVCLEEVVRTRASLCSKSKRPFD